MSHRDSVAVLSALFRGDGPRPIVLLGAGASFRSGVPTAAEAVKQIARLVYSRRVLAGARPPERVKPSEWEPWLKSSPWFISGADRLAENFPLAVQHLLTPAEFRRRVMLELMTPRNELSVGYKVLAELVLRGLLHTVLTTNFDTCLPDALNARYPHIRHVHEINKRRGDYDEFSVYNKCQIVWLHGRAENYSDKNAASEIDALDAELVNLLRPLLSAPIIVVGYRGAEASVMECLFAQTSQGRRDFAHGIYWCVRDAESMHPNVEALARRVAGNFHRLTIKGFDELFVDLEVELKATDRYTETIRSVDDSEEHKAFDERLVDAASLDDLDLDLALTVLRTYCEKLGRAPVTSENLQLLMREQGLIVRENATDKITAAALLLFGKRPQDFFPHAVISTTEAGKKRRVYDGNLITQHRQLLERLEEDDVNPRLKVKRRRQHEEQRAYPPRVLVELVVNLLVHRDYELPEASQIEIFPGREIVFANPGALTQSFAARVAVEHDGRIVLAEAASDQRNPALCDIFFGLSAMERAGTGLLDVSKLMLDKGGASAFYHYSKELRFKASVTQPEASAGSRSIARSTVPTGLYVLNALPFSVIPEEVSIVVLTRPLWERPPEIDLTRRGTFIRRDSELWSFVPMPLLLDVLGPIADHTASRTVPREKLQSRIDDRRVLSWLLRKHWERYVFNFQDSGLLLEEGKKHRAYFEGKAGGPRSILWNSAQRRGNRREVVKQRADGPRTWFENEGFGYEIIEIDGQWCVRIKPFYMFTGRNARTPLPLFARVGKATSRMKFDRNKNVEADLMFWSSFLGRGSETMNIGDAGLNDLIVEASFVTVEVAETGLLANEHQNRLSA